MRLEAPRNEAALIALGLAQFKTIAIGHEYDDEGKLLAYLVPNDLDLTGYDEAVEEARMASGYALLLGLTDAQASEVKPRDLARLSARAYDMIPVRSAFVKRVATAAGITPAAWFTAAGA